MCVCIYIYILFQIIKADNHHYIYYILHIYNIHIYVCMCIRSICGQQLFRSLRPHQRSSDQMKIYYQKKIKDKKKCNIKDKRSKKV